MYSLDDSSSVILKGRVPGLSMDDSVFLEKYKDRGFRESRSVSMLRNRDNADDTLTQLYSGKKKGNVPTHLKKHTVGADLNGLQNLSAKSNGSGNYPHRKPIKASVPVVHVVPDKFPQTSLTTTPKKQLRFDLDSTMGSTVSDSPQKSLRTSTYQPVSKARPESPTSILKKRHRGIKPVSYYPQDGSLTTEDVRLEHNVYSRREEFRQKTGMAKHSRSFSASGRLSSTPIRNRSGVPPDMERPYISDVSSVRESFTGSPARINGDRSSPTRSVDQLSEDSSKQVEAAVNEAERAIRQSYVTRNSGSEDNKRTLNHGRQLLMNPCLPGEPELSDPHRQYLQNLVREIEESSSSIATGYTELQDLLQPNDPDTIADDVDSGKAFISPMKWSSLTSKDTGQDGGERNGN